jgi:hypothetical protein
MMFAAQALDPRPLDVWKGLGIGVTLHALTWATLFGGIHPTTFDTLIGAILGSYPRLVQWAYLLPAYWLARHRNRPEIGTGIISLGFAALLVNIVAAGMLSVRR